MATSKIVYGYFYQFHLFFYVSILNYSLLGMFWYQDHQNWLKTDVVMNFLFFQLQISWYRLTLPSWIHLGKSETDIVSHMQKLACRYSQYCSYNEGITACVSKLSIPSASSFSFSQTFVSFVRSWRRSTMMAVGRWRRDHELFLLSINIWWEVQWFIFCLHFAAAMMAQVSFGWCLCSGPRSL